MNTPMKGAAKRLTLSLLVALSASGCAYYSPPYAAPYAAYEPYYGYSYPYYAGPPVSLGLGFSFHEYRGRGHHGHHGWGHGYRGGGGWGHGGRGGWGRGGGHYRGRH